MNQVSVGAADNCNKAVKEAEAQVAKDCQKKFQTFKSKGGCKRIIPQCPIEKYKVKPYHNTGCIEIDGTYYAIASGACIIKCFEEVKDPAGSDGEASTSESSIDGGME